MQVTPSSTLSMGYGWESGYVTKWYQSKGFNTRPLET